MASSFWCLLSSLAVLAAGAGLERAGDRTALPSAGVDPVFNGPEARQVVSVEAAGARCAIPADFDQDGDMDIVAVSSNDNTVAWYERLNDGTYGNKRMISRASNGARIVTVGDIDQDGHVDVIVASYYDHTVGWFRNLGGGKFDSMDMITRTAISAQGVSVADIDNDGDLDVLSASSGDNTVAWYENLGGGAFCEKKNIVDSESIGVRTVNAADLNHDGFVDLVVASKDDNSITWYRNDGKQNFEKIRIDSEADGAYSLVVVDVDKDGYLDVVGAANSEGMVPENGEGGMVSFYRNGFGSDGKLCNFTKISVTKGNTTGTNDFDWFVLSVWAGDLDMDGDIDIASASFSLLHQGGISWYENTDGQGKSWTRHKIYTTPSAKTGHYVYGADMDGDGDTDLVAVTNGDNKVQILLANTSCDDSKNNPRASCCSSSQYWDGRACTSCALGQFFDSSISACSDCSSSCPRPGLAWQPFTCHSMAGCESASAAVAHCTCGHEQYLDSSLGICVSCPRGHVTLDNLTRTMDDFVKEERKFLDQTKYMISDLSWWGFNQSRCLIPECSAGTAFDMSLKACSTCPAGKYSLGGSVTSCQECPAGSKCAGPTPTEPCQAGYYSPAGSSDCSTAPAGSHTPRAGMDAPVACPAGSYSSQSGQKDCQSCSVGGYSNLLGQTACISCGQGKRYPDLWTTMRRVESAGQVKRGYHEGAGSEDFCTCDVGARLVGNECVNCSTGMTCPGMGDVQIQSGFYADLDFSVFSCIQQSHCSGGTAGDTCAPGRTGIACAECLPDHTPSYHGECKPCTGSDLAPFVVCVVVSLGFLGVFYALIVSKGEEREGHAALIAITSVGLLLAVVQQVSIVAQIEVYFIEPISTFFKFFSVLLFDLEIFNLGCVAHMTPLSSFIVTVLVVVAGLVSVCFFHVIYVLLRRGGRFGNEMHRLINALGFFAIAFYISVTSTVLGPYQCKQNPNSLWTARKYESVVCWETDAHYMMIGVGAAALMMPLAFLSYTFLAVKRFPKQMMEGNASFLKSHRFLFSKYASDRYWCTLFYLVRSVLLSVTPLIPHAVLQVLLTQGIVLAQLVFSLHVKPYRNDECTLLEVASSICVLSLLVICPFFASPTEEMRVIAAWLGLSVVAVACVLLLLGIAMATLRRFRQRRKKSFQYFLCHHKAGAGSFCRLLKMQLQQTPGAGNVFIDSDDLKNLDMLFDYVGSQTENIVVIMSKDIFFRPWCMGELVTAKANSVRLIKLVLPDYVPYDPEFIINYAHRVPEVSQLVPEGIDVPMVQDMLRWMRDQQNVITLPNGLSENIMGDLCTRITASTFGTISVEQTSLEALNTRTAILADHTNMEAVSAAYILARLLVPHFAHDAGRMPKVLGKGQELSDATSVILIICTNGAFLQANFLRHLIVAEELDAQHVPILAREGFRFPTGEFLEDHRPVAASLSDDPDAVLALVGRVFKAIAVVFQPEHYASTEQLLATKALEAAQRLGHPALMGKLSASLSDWKRQPSKVVKVPTENTVRTEDDSKENPDADENIFQCPPVPSSQQAAIIFNGENSQSTLIERTF